jgi:hypothetical protein
MSGKKTVAGSKSPQTGSSGGRASGRQGKKRVRGGCVCEEFLYYISEHLTNDEKPFKK